MDNNNQEIMSRLKFIGKLKKGEKINTSYMYVQPEGLLTSFSRTFLYQDNRANTLHFVNNTILRAFDILKVYERSCKESEKLLSNHIVNDLQNASIGLANLKLTYVNDTKFCCDMDTLLELIQAKLSLNHDKLSEEKKLTGGENNNYYSSELE